MEYRGKPTHEFHCEKCDEGFDAAAGASPHIRKVKRGVVVENYRFSFCPKCRKECRVDVPENEPAACSAKKTKIFKKGGKTFRVHDKRAISIPADLAEVVDNANRMFEEQGYPRIDDGEEEAESPREAGADEQDDRIPDRETQ